MILFLKNLVFTILFPGSVAGSIPWLLVYEVPLALTPWAYPAGLCFLAGTSIYVWCANDIGEAYTDYRAAVGRWLPGIKSRLRY